MLKSFVLVIVTAGVSFGIAATTGIGAPAVKEPVYLLRGDSAAATAPTLNLRCEYDSGAYFKSQPYLLCGHFVQLNAGGTRVLAALGLVVRIRAARIDVERYGEQGYEKTLAVFRR